MKVCDCGLKIKGREHNDKCAHYLCLDCGYYEVEERKEKKIEEKKVIRIA